MTPVEVIMLIARQKALADAGNRMARKAHQDLLRAHAAQLFADAVSLRQLVEALPRCENWMRDAESRLPSEQCKRVATWSFTQAIDTGPVLYCDSCMNGRKPESSGWSAELSTAAVTRRLGL